MITRIVAYLRASTKEALRGEAERQGTSMSRLLERYAKTGLKTDGAAIVETRVEPSAPLPFGEPDEA